MTPFPYLRGVLGCADGTEHFVVARVGVLTVRPDGARVARMGDLVFVTDGGDLLAGQ